MRTTGLILTAALAVAVLAGSAWGQTADGAASQPLTPEQLNEIAAYWATYDDGAPE